MTGMFIVIAHLIHSRLCHECLIIASNDHSIVFAKDDCENKRKIFYFTFRVLYTVCLRFYTFIVLLVKGENYFIIYLFETFDESAVRNHENLSKLQEGKNRVTTINFNSQSSLRKALSYRAHIVLKTKTIRNKTLKLLQLTLNVSFQTTPVIIEFSPYRGGKERTFIP